MKSHFFCVFRIDRAMYLFVLFCAFCMIEIYTSVILVLTKDIPGCLIPYIQGGAVAEWVRVSTGDRTLDGSSPTAVNLFSSELWQFRLPRLPVSFGGDSKSRWSLLSGVYARGSKRSHQSALECVSVVDSTSHSRHQWTTLEISHKTFL